MSPTQWPKQPAGSPAASGSESMTAAAWVRPSEGGEITPANDPVKTPATVDPNGQNQQAAALVAALSAVIPGLQSGLAGTGAAAPTGDAALDPEAVRKNNDFLNTAFYQANIALGDVRSGVEYGNQLAARGEVAGIEKPWENGLLERLKTT